MPSEQRLHPATLLFDLVTHIKRFAVPALLVMFGASRSSGGADGPFGWVPSGWESWLLVMLVPAVLMTRRPLPLVPHPLRRPRAGDAVRA